MASSKWPKNSLKKITFSTHKIKASSFPKSSLEIINSLNRNGFQAYLVGGCIRDKLLKITPKDFDISTNATPEQIKRILPRSRIIGRRFKLVHVRKGREIIEVSTFRSLDNSNVQNHEGMILKDNIYGTSLEDALRRDLTINALFYDVETQEILDFTSGYSDVMEGRIRVIGDIEKRFKEDPIRMLRAIRFSSKLRLKLEDSIIIKIKELGHLLLNIPSARRLDEVNKLFLNGYALHNFKLLIDLDLLKYLFPLLKDDSLKKQHQMSVFLDISFKNTDHRVKKNKPVMISFLMAAILWPSLIEKIGEVASPSMKIYDIRNAAIIILKQQSNFCFITAKMQSIIIDIWELQLRLMRTNNIKTLEIINHKKFRAGYDFLINREEAGLYLFNLGSWWTDFQNVGLKQRKSMIRNSQKYGTKKYLKERE